VLFILGTLAYAQRPPVTVGRSAPIKVPEDTLTAGAMLPISLSNQQASDKPDGHNGKAIANKNGVDRPMTLRRQEAERIVGEKMVSEFEPHSTFISDPTITQYVNRLEQTIVLNSGIRGRYVVKVINDVEVNAFSLPGGFLYVNSGLILAAENEAQLVGALAHETGHVTARHLTKLETKKRIVGRLFLLGGPAGYAIRELFGSLFLLKLARNAEFEADRVGLTYQYASGYDQTQFVRFLCNAFSDEEEAGFLARLRDEHPLVETRVNRATRIVAHYAKPRTDYVIDTNDFHEIKMRVAAAMGVSNPDSSRASENKGDWQQTTSCDH